jgi:ATP-binding cassette subfamily B protein
MDYQARRLKVIETTLAFIPVSGVAPLISFGILMGLGLERVLNGDLSVGGFLALQAYVFKIQAPLQELGQLVSEWQRGWASLDRLHKIFKVPEVPRLRSGGEVAESKDSNNVVFKAVQLGFHYHPSQPLWKPFDLEIRSGEKIGIQGPVGTGKSTLIEILAGFEDGYSGTLQFHNTEMRRLSHAPLRSRIAIVPQKPFLFASSLRKNVAFQKELPDSQIWHWLQVTGLDHDLRALPSQLDTRLGEWGINLSGGQKQRLTLARALAAQPEVLLLDDCLSAVDTITEERILRALREELQGLTVIWVAHRESTLKGCDRILSLRAGEEPRWTR